MELMWPEQQLFVKKPKFWMLGSEIFAARFVRVPVVLAN